MSNKLSSNSERNPVSTLEDNTTLPNRRARRKDKQKQSTAASSSKSRTPPTLETSSMAGEASNASQAADEKTSFGNADFIAFSFSESEEADRPSAPQSPPPAGEWGKGKEREEHAGRKRKAEEINFSDGYANKKQRVAAASRRAPWARDVNWDRCVNVAEMLHNEVQAFANYMSPTPIEDELRALSVELIARAITNSYPDAQVLPFGSYDTKLYLPLGDIDLVIYSHLMTRMDKVPVLHSIANIMKRAGITDRVTIIAKAKVPIVKFVTAHGRFSVDISVNQGNGVGTGQMVKQFLRELPALRSLVLIIKNFLSQRSMNEVFTGGLGSYSIVCLVISFLQMHPKIRRGEIDASKNLGVLVMEFFELYGSYFNYQEVGISLRDGGSYFNKRQRGWLDYREPRLLSIEDPGDSTNDISRGSYNFARVRTTLAGAHGIMTAAAYAQASIISSRREGHNIRLRPASDPEEMSILASVMGVTQETINHRRVVQEVYDRQVLHRMLGITPQPSLSYKGPTVSVSRTAEAESVQNAWGHSDMDMGTPEASSAEETIKSRYDIEGRRQPPKKRRRTGRVCGDNLVDTFYTTDDEEDRFSVVHRPSGDDENSEEEQQYSLSALDADNQERGGDKAKKRSYWLSKAMAGVSSSDD